MLVFYKHHFTFLSQLTLLLVNGQICRAFSTQNAYILNFKLVNKGSCLNGETLSVSYQLKLKKLNPIVIHFLNISLQIQIILK